VIVLNQHDRGRHTRLFGDRLGKLAIDELVGAEVLGVERRRHRGAMAERPQCAVRESIVVAAVLSRRQPHTAQPVTWCGRRHVDAVSIHRRLMVGVPLAGGNPHAAVLQKQWFDRVDDAR
jgi:hypothetical protein